MQSVIYRTCFLQASCRERLCDWGPLMSWDAEPGSTRSPLPGRGTSCGEVPPPQKAALMVWACSLPPVPSLLSAVTLRPTECPGKEPTCPLMGKKSGFSFCGRVSGWVRSLEGHPVRCQPTVPRCRLGAGAAAGLDEEALGRGQHRQASPPVRS